MLMEAKVAREDCPVWGALEEMAGEVGEVSRMESRENLVHKERTDRAEKLDCLGSLGKPLCFKSPHGFFRV
jgi:hypothetical protein